MIQLTAWPGVKVFLAKDHLNPLLSVGLCTLLALQLLYTVFLLAQISSDWPTLMGYDNDGANAVEAVEMSGGFQDNDFPPYGMLYYKLAYHLEKFNPAISRTSPDRYGPERSRSYHFALMLTAYLAMLGLCMLLACAILHGWPERLLGVLLLEQAFLVDSTWMEFIVKTRPDTLLSLLVGAAVYSGLRYLISDRKPAWLAASAVSWGLAFATKMSIVLFIPALGLFFLPELCRRKWMPAIGFGLLLLAVYFAANFPQSKAIMNIVNLLGSQGEFSSAPNRESVSRVLFLLVRQSFWPAVVLLGLSFLFRLKTPDVVHLNRDFWLGGGSLVVVPVLLLLTRHILSPYDHFVMPSVVALLVLLAFAFAAWADHIRGIGFCRGIASFQPAPLVILGGCLLAGAVVRWVAPSQFEAWYRERREKKEASAGMLRQVVPWQEQGRWIHADPYVPFLRNTGKFTWSWKTNIGRIRPGKAEILVLRPLYYRRYLMDRSEAQPFHQKIAGNEFFAMQEFYRLFAGRRETVDPFGRTWKKKYSGDIEIWEIVKSPVSL